MGQGPGAQANHSRALLNHERNYLEHFHAQRGANVRSYS